MAVQIKPQVHFKPLLAEDAWWVAELRNLPQVRAGFFDQGIITPEQQADWFKEYLFRGDDLMWILTVDGHRVGAIAIYHIDSPCAELGRLMIHPDYQGRGIASEGVRMAVQHAERTLGITLLYLQVKLDNPAAIRVYRKAGFATYLVDENRMWMTRGLS